MRILFVAWRDLDNDLAGGSEVLIDRLASGLVERDHDVALMCAQPVGPRAYPVTANGGFVDQFARAPFTYARRYRDRDLVVDVANGMAFFAPLWRRGPSLCFVNHIHTEQWNQWFPAPVAAFGRNMERQVMPRVYKDRLFVSVSPSTSQGLASIGVDPSQIRTIINGTDLSPEVGAEAAEPTFVSLGRMVPHKRLDIMLRAWDQVRPETGGRLVLIGDGPDRPRLEAMAGPGVEFTGKIPETDKQRLLSEAWLLVHTASHEGWGLVIMEAAGHGTPALAFRVAGIRDSVAPGISGELVDDEHELARRWAALAGDASLRARYRTGARERAASFTWANTIDSFLAVAEEAIDRHGRPKRSRQGRPATGAPAGSDNKAVIDLRPAPAVFATNVVSLEDHAAGRPPELSVVIPAYDEAARLPISLPLLIEALAGTDTEIVVVDDGSSDHTREVAAQLLEGAERTQVHSLDRHRGKGAAVRAGIQAARGRVLTFMDADLAADIAFLPSLLDGLADHHIAIGSRSAPGAVTNGWTPSQDAAHRSFNQLARYATGLSLHDFQCGFKAFRAPVAKLLFHLSEEEGFAFDVELLAIADRIGYRTAEIPVHWQAVRGSHTRIVVDSALMALQVGRIGVRQRSGRLLPAIEAWPRDGGAGGADLAEELRSHLHQGAPVIPWNQGALALLPFTELHDSRELAAALQDRLPGLVVKPNSFDAGTILDPASHKLRSALAAC